MIELAYFRTRQQGIKKEAYLYETAPFFNHSKLFYYLGNALLHPSFCLIPDAFISFIGIG